MNTIQVGNVTVEQTASLAPMASVADRTFRTLCRSYGAAMVTGEMASAKGMMYSDKKTAELLEVTEAERPMAVQPVSYTHLAGGVAHADAGGQKNDPGAWLRGSRKRRLRSG